MVATPVLLSYVDPWVKYPADYDFFDRRYGRWMRAWPGLRALSVVENIRSVQHKPGTRAEWRYYLTRKY